MTETEGGLDKVAEVLTWRDSKLFSASERAALEYAERITYTDRQVDDALFAELKRHFTEAQIVQTELALKAWSDVANITFVRAGSGTSGEIAYSNSASILFGSYTGGQDGAAAFGYFPGSRSFGSAVHGRIWTSLWIYFTAPPLGMLLAAEGYLRLGGAHRVFCAKLHHHNDQRCIFRCNFGEIA